MASVDALRGLAIILLVLMEFLQQGGFIARVNPHPVVYPSQPLISLGIKTTWLDLSVPLLLLALGISIAFSYHRSRLLGLNHLVIALRIIARTLLLLFFAIAYQALAPLNLGIVPNFSIWLLSLLSFGAFFLIFLQPKPTWNSRRVSLVKVIGWLVIILLLFALRYPDRSGFLLQRNNTLLILVANVYGFSALLYLLTPQRWLPRLGVLGILLALRISYPFSDLVQTIWNWTPLFDLFQPDFSLYLFIVVPGTIIGDILVSWQPQLSKVEIQQSPHLYSRLLSLIVFTALTVTFFLVNLLGEKDGLLAFLGVVWLIFGSFILYRPQTTIECELRRIYYWGGYWVLVALILRPFARAFPNFNHNMSYYFLITGLAILLLAIFIILVEFFRQSAKWLHFLVDLGQNSLLAYTAPNFFLLPILNLTPVHQLLLTLNFQPWWEFVRALFYTILLTLTVIYCNRKNLIWRI